MPYSSAGSACASPCHGFLVGVVVVGNAAWTLASIALLFSGAVTPNLFGEAIVAAQAIVVGVLAELQFIGLRRSSDLVAA